MRQGKVGFGINHQMRDFRQNRKKDLDLVVCLPDTGANPSMTFARMVEKYGIRLTTEEADRLAALPEFHMAAVGTVRMALEAKACMTAHGKARPRLYDELTSSHLTIHGDTSGALAVGFVMINTAARFVSPGHAQNARSLKEAEPFYNTEPQPQATISVVEKVKELPRSSREGEQGFDALGVVLIECKNDGTEVKVLDRLSNGYQVDDIFRYETMIKRVAHIYAARYREF